MEFDRKDNIIKGYAGERRGINIHRVRPELEGKIPFKMLDHSSSTLEGLDL
jgi:hypothetical protein